MFDKLNTTLLQLGFHPSKCDPSMFIYQHNSQIVYILVYVDDISSRVHLSLLFSNSLTG